MSCSIWETTHAELNADWRASGGMQAFPENFRDDAEHRAAIERLPTSLNGVNGASGRAGATRPAVAERDHAKLSSFAE